MRVMLDSNVIISYILFNNKTMSLFFDYVLNNETLLISNQIEEELRKVFNKKFPNKINDLEDFLDELDCEKVQVEKIENNAFEIRDAKDYPIFYSAIIGNADIFITGDSDFNNVIVDKPLIMSIKEYITNYIIK